MTTFEQVRPIADTVLYEGYVLYPYRADDGKNRVRWQFGVLVPRALSEADPSERSRLRCDLLLEARPERVDVRLRFIQVQRRTVQQRRPDTDSGFEEVPQLDAGDTTYLPFDEAVPHDVDVTARLADLVSGVAGTPRVEPVAVGGGVDTEAVPGGRLVRERLPLSATVTLSASPLPGPYGVTRLRVDVDNTTAWEPQQRARAEALRHSLVAAHLLVRVDRGRFLSLTDPPEWATGYVESCENDGAWPVLAGADHRSDLVLCSPIILPDHPELAPESTTEFFDGTEMDEMLSLRALTLTDAEKRAVRGTDPRAAKLLDDVENLPAALMDRLHGAVRYLGATARIVPPQRADEPEEFGARVEKVDAVDIGGVEVREGSRVLLRPGIRRADAQDLFIAGRTATVTTVLQDVDGNDHVAVLLDDDPGQDISRVYGRYLYFAPDEIEPIGRFS